jgi:hypothetical protein
MPGNSNPANYLDHLSGRLKARQEVPKLNIRHQRQVSIREVRGDAVFAIPLTSA